MGFLSFRLGELNEAERWFMQVADADGTSYLAHYYLALPSNRTSSGELVETSLRRAIASNPAFVPAILALSAHLARKTGQEEEALELARDATRLAPELGETRMNLAEFLDRMGREDEAAEAARRAR